MRITKTFLLSAILLTLAAGTVGCATSNPLGMSTLNKPGSSDSMNQPAQQASFSPATAPLITLGQNDNFHEIVDNAAGVVLVDFYADWCGPCRTQGGILHDMELSAEQNHASIVKVNIDQHRQLADEFSVSSLPTLIVIKNGKILERQTGIANHQQVASYLTR